jgi:hypothetical protein
VFSCESKNKNIMLLNNTNFSKSMLKSQRHLNLTKASSWPCVNRAVNLSRVSVTKVSWCDAGERWPTFPLAWRFRSWFIYFLMKLPFPYIYAHFITSKSHEPHQWEIPFEIRIVPHLFFYPKDVIYLSDTTRKMIYCNTWDPLLVSAGNNSRY